MVRTVYLQGVWYTNVGCKATRSRSNDSMDDLRLGCLFRGRNVEKLVE